MVGFNKQSMSNKYRGMTIAEAAELRGETPEEAIVNLIIEDEAEYSVFTLACQKIMSEKNNASMGFI